MKAYKRPEEDHSARRRAATSRTGSTASRGRRSRRRTSTTPGRSPRRSCSATWRMRFAGHEADVGRQRPEVHQLRTRPTRSSSTTTARAGRWRTSGLKARPPAAVGARGSAPGRP
ncbi:MAG: hypothetical protein MZW92_40475 [Comamonadaceae bacterium]|nr:hypothetical protein [Comamonadaceae bacterium]